jgi:hypothetical protein
MIVNPQNRARILGFGIAANPGSEGVIEVEVVGEAGKAHLVAAGQLACTLDAAQMGPFLATAGVDPRELDVVEALGSLAVLL